MSYKKKPSSPRAIGHHPYLRHAVAPTRAMPSSPLSLQFPRVVDAHLHHLALSYSFVSTPTPASQGVSSIVHDSLSPSKKIKFKFHQLL
jgi:hypothetical protein